MWSVSTSLRPPRRLEVLSHLSYLGVTISGAAETILWDDILESEISYLSWLAKGA